MAAALLVDTDVMVDFLRGQPRAVAFMSEAPLPLALSVVTVAELYAGVREDEESAILARSLAACDIRALDTEVAARSGLLRRDYGKSHGVGLADALIAATAELHGLKLVTLNRKHYPMLDTVMVPYRKD